MFICQECGKQSKPGEGQFTKVVSTRYPRYYVNEVKKEGGGKIIIESVGWEIVKENKVCEGCFGF